MAHVTARLDRDRARLAHMLNARERTIGVDKNALNDQVRDHTLQRRASQQEQAAFAFSEKAALQAASIIETQARIEDAHKRAELRAVWDQQVDKTKRTTWELEDPSQVRRAPLARDPRPAYETGNRGHASAVQVFPDAEAREDPRYLRAKKEAAREGFIQGMMENGMRRQAEKEEMGATAMAMATTTSTIGRMEDRAFAERRAMALMNAQDNKVLLASRRASETVTRVEEQRSRRASVDAQLASPLLREDSRTGYWASNPGRIRPDQYKGMSHQQAAAVRKENEEQMYKKALDREYDAQRRAAADAAAVTVAQAATTMANMEAADQKARQRQYALELKQQADADAARRAAIRAGERRAQHPTNAGFLAGFGQSLR